MEEVKKYLNEGAKEFLDSLKKGTLPVHEDEEEFFELLKSDSEIFLSEKIDQFTDPDYKEIDPSEKFLGDYYRETNKKNLDVAILSVDIIGSTKMSHNLTKEKYSKIISLYLREISFIVNNYNGYSLKYIGDEIIAYFPGPNLTGMHDNALFCAYAIKKYIIKILNPLLLENNLPEINFRLSLNSGNAMIIIAGHPNSMQHYDLIGEPINLTKKIQGKAEPNMIVVGQSTKSHAHKFWSTKTEEIIANDFQGFKIYKLNIKI